jgi:hypothetical protein
MWPWLLRSCVCKWLFSPLLQFGLELLQMSSSSTRSRYNGEVGKLHAVLAPFVTSVGWLLYQESATDTVKPELLVAHKFLIQALTSLCANLSFSKKHLEVVFRMIERERLFPELLNDDAKKDWVETMSSRVFMACRHIAQARLRKPTKPRWLANIDGDDSQPPMSEESQASEHGEKLPRVAAEDAQVPETPQDIEHMMNRTVYSQL